MQRLASFAPLALFAAAAALAPAGCTTAETAGTNWSCSSDADCADGKVCWRYVVAGSEEGASAARRCVAPEAAPVVLGSASFFGEPYWRPAVDACVRRVNAGADGNRPGIEGHPLDVRWKQYDVTAFLADNPQSQYRKVLEFSNAPDAQSPRGPASVDALYGLLGQLYPGVKEQFSSVTGKDLLLFGSTDGDPALRDPPAENLYFWRPSIDDEMSALVDAIFAVNVNGQQINDPKDVFVAFLNFFFPSSREAFVRAWNARGQRLIEGGRPVQPITGTGDFFHFAEYFPPNPENMGATYDELVTAQRAEGEKVIRGQRFTDFVAQKAGRPVALVSLGGPADTAGMISTLNARVTAGELPATLLEPGALGIYLNSYQVPLLGPLLSVPGSTPPVQVLRLASGTAPVPDPLGATRVAQSYRTDIAGVPDQSQVGFEGYIGCLYFAEVLRKSVRERGNVDSASLRATLNNFTADVGLGPMTVGEATNYVATDVYLYNYTDPSDPLRAKQFAVWSKSGGLRPTAP